MGFLKVERVKGSELILVHINTKPNEAGFNAKGSAATSCLEKNWTITSRAPNHRTYSYIYPKKSPKVF